MLAGMKERWMGYMNNEINSKDIRADIFESWERCRKMKVNHLAGYGKKAGESQLKESVLKRQELIKLSRPIMENVFEMVKNTSYSVVLTDENGIIIDLIINKDIMDFHSSLNFVKGSLWDEKSVGTNAIGTCLAINKPIQVIGAEHYCEYHHKWTCSAAPIHNSKGEIIGSFDISGRAEDVQTHTFGIAASSAECIEKQLVISESYNLMDTTFDSILDGVMVIDSNMKIVKINNKIPELFHMDEKDIFNINVNKMLNGVEIEKDIFESKNKLSFSDLTISIDNKKIECSLSISPLTEGKVVTGAVILMREAKQVIKEVSKLAGFKANFTFDNIITVNDRMNEIINSAKKISKTNCSVLIEGESGVGKELYAQSIHNESYRRKGPFVAINCSAIPKELFESELFGYESGSFTGAMKGGRPGKFELARGGTIFLDEIGEIPQEVQPKLLRVLDNNKIVRIGGTYERELDVRVISATNRNLFEEVAKGSFRQDLYFRLNVINLRVPPLRKRKEDILELARYFLKSLNYENRDVNNKKTFSKGFENKLVEYEWTGNVRELKNIIQRAYYMAEGEIIKNVSLPLNKAAKSVRETANLNLKDIERDSIVQALSFNNRNVLKAAKDLNISKATIYRKIKAYSIDLDDIERLAQ
ncbi:MULTISPECIES: sigma-54-dependent Fis family transcriptional regulator [unclassified Sedimentibacter]|uniref:sigma-54-dependent Fis family transcriptional regulator n=1 Tax=unclassified Sedimentibacter TaxID=2649220 RepID=UPI0027E1EBAC|nr:sigma-54-dependent Fis family transcriptional regulator [Sedimentibacter sp. MB35-C1]WMJ78816.1 sigma-54-dependent Fis family transcriptional regulator [Sedimentibacter sp. MB35-C1]